jgi:hypothetical protein
VEEVTEFSSKWLGFSGETLQYAGAKSAKSPGHPPSGTFGTPPPGHLDPEYSMAPDASPEHLADSHGPIDSTTKAQSETGRLMERLCAWAGKSADRWKRVHSRLIGGNAPDWVLVEARCVLVAWAAAWMAMTKAQQELTRLENLRGPAARANSRLARPANQSRPLTRAQQASLAAREADVHFWGRVTRHFAPQVSDALAADRWSARILAKLATESNGS